MMEMFYNKMDLPKQAHEIFVCCQTGRFAGKGANRQRAERGKISEET